MEIWRYTGYIMDYNQFVRKISILVKTTCLIPWDDSKIQSLTPSSILEPAGDCPHKLGVPAFNQQYMRIAGIKSWNRPPSNDDDCIMIILSSYVLLANLPLKMLARLLLTKSPYWHLVLPLASKRIFTPYYLLVELVNCFAAGFLLCFGSFLSYFLVLICF